ncbi:filamentous hemagglutinin N-terminal domain-containing protein [Candidatus Halobeggiatoa sp. HSG11]|nr:filamentous hemagglutinin N-terminal domain-containing protein [Candidatus Halobeggiatoa sp. HSG11]
MILRNALNIVMVFLLVFSININAEVILDGTLGTDGAITGPDFLIDADLGKQVGTNLFHSFESFNLNPIENATFTGPADISNVINRVTGGQPSFINGRLSSKIPNADIYFLNPQGVMFGQKATLDIQGSLHISTADYLKLEDGGRFDITTPANSLLTTAPPSAFGFLDAPSDIIIKNSLLHFPNREMLTQITNGENVGSNNTLSLVGGNIFIQDAQIITGGNNIHLVSVAATGEAPIESNAWTDDTFTSYGTLNIVDTGAFPRGAFGNIDASGSGGGEIFIRAGQIVLDNGWIFADTWLNQNGQGINIHADETLTMKNGSRITTAALDLTQKFNPNFIGVGGDINVSANNINIIDGSQIQSNSRTSGNSGNINLFVQNTVFLKGSITINEQQNNSGILSNTLLLGNGGEINIFSKDLIMKEGATIRGETWGIGNAGNLSINVNTLTLSDSSNINISSGFFGMVNNIDNFNTYKYWVSGFGKAGILNVTAKESIYIDSNSGFFSNTFTRGSGGLLNITTPTMKITESGTIQAGTQLFGNGGYIVLNVGSLQLTESGFITAESRGTGFAGDIVLNLNDSLTMKNSFIRTSAIKADGGNLTIKTPSYVYAVDSQITTSVSEDFGGGGNITINPEFIVMDGSTIFAKAKKGAGGNINIATTGIYNFTGESIAQIINASSEFGMDGIVTIETPDNNSDEGLFSLPTTLFDASKFINTPCAQKVAANISSFILTPSEGNSNAVGDLLSSGIALTKLNPVLVGTQKKGLTITDNYARSSFATCNL